MHLIVELVQKLCILAKIVLFFEMVPIQYDIVAQLGVQLLASKS